MDQAAIDRGDFLPEEIEALKTGKTADTTTPTKGKFTAARIAQARDDFPEMAEMTSDRRSVPLSPIS